MLFDVANLPRPLKKGYIVPDGVRTRDSLETGA